MSDITKEPDVETTEGGPTPPPPAPSLVEVFRQSADALHGLNADEQQRVLKALCILFEVKP